MVRAPIQKAPTTDTNTTLDKETVLELLKTVNEPELDQNLVELKMVKDVVVDGGKVIVSIELPTPASTSRGKIQEDVTERLMQNGAAEVEIEWSARVRSSSGSHLCDQRTGPGEWIRPALFH